MIRSRMESSLAGSELGWLIGMDVRGHWLARCWRGGLKADDTQVLDTMVTRKSGVEGD